MNATPAKTPLKDILAQYLFWSWNVIFLAFMVLGFAPRMLPELLPSVRTGLIPVAYLYYATILSLIPLLTAVLGLLRLRNEPARLFALGYVVEGPLMLMLALRFFLVREAAPGMVFLLLVAGLGMATFLWHVLDKTPEGHGRLLGSLRLVGLTLMALTSLYAAVWIAFYAVPLAGEAVRWLGRTLVDIPAFLFGVRFSLKEMIRQGLTWITFSILGFILFLYTATLFVLTPIAVPVLSLKAWWSSLKSLAGRTGRLLPVSLVVVTVATTGVLFVISNRQPQKSTFALLAKPPETIDQAQALLKQKESIRRGLLNAYLAPFRYLSATGEVRHISDLYEGTFNLPASSAFTIQRWYEAVAKPLLYDPVQPQAFGNVQDNLAFDREPRQAARLYQRFFDEPIVEGERPTIVRAVRSTWSAEQAESAWQAVDEHEVHLNRQEVTVSEHGDWAEVELYEVYQNQTANRQEVIYYFNLPESAVLTGVWLGNSPDRASRFVFQVAARGAAQAVYRNETRVNRDPALLEQIGPRQYRLRAFPVLPIALHMNDQGTRTVVEDAEPLYLWMTYRTFSEGGAWPLPRLALHRNVYWDRETIRQVNGDPMQVSGDAWLPESIPAAGSIQPAAHRVDFPTGASILITPVNPASLAQLPSGVRLAVVLDRSFSMSAQSERVAAAFSRLQEVLGSEDPFDIYLTASNYRGEAPSRVASTAFDPSQAVYFGGQNAADLLAQFDQLSAGRDYDAILVFTDGSGYELGAAQVDMPVPAAPVWMVHLGDDISLGYDDQTLEAIQASGGGVSGSLDEALARLAQALHGTASSGEMRDVLDGYVWSVAPTSQVENSQAAVHSGDDPFIALAARRLILAEMQRQRGTIDQLETLDQLNALAQQYGIITPYSSMIVLVNETQKNLLENLEGGNDRYNREFEELKDTTPATSTPLTGVPEPGEWLLIGLAAVMLAWYAFQQNAARAHG